MTPRELVERWAGDQYRLKTVFREPNREGEPCEIHTDNKSLQVFAVGLKFASLVVVVTVVVENAKRVHGFIVTRKVHTTHTYLFRLWEYKNPDLAFARLLDMDQLEADVLSDPKRAESFIRRRLKRAADEISLISKPVDFFNQFGNTGREVRDFSGERKYDQVDVGADVEPLSAQKESRAPQSRPQALPRVSRIAFRPVVTRTRKRDPSQMILPLIR
jgi:hypothetical protein